MAMLDPTRTTTIRRQFETQIRKRLVALRRALMQWVGTQDELGLAPIRTELSLNRQFEFATNEQKLKGFQAWLQQQTDGGLLEVIPETGEPWSQTYVESAYKRGMTNAYISARPELSEGVAFGMSKAEFLRIAFNAPEALSKIKLLGMRSFEALKNINQSMAADMNRILADGMAAGKGPRQVALELSRGVESMSRKRALVIARTEIIHAHAEGQLDNFVNLGVEELGIQSELRTVGDDRVCPICRPLEGRVYTVAEARGVIPLHPNCRCAWVPHFPARKAAKKEKLKRMSRGEL